MCQSKTNPIKMWRTNNIAGWEMEEQSDDFNLEFLPAMEIGFISSFLLLR
jgi:hypothetical protein